MSVGWVRGEEQEVYKKEQRLKEDMLPGVRADALQGEGRTGCATSQFISMPVPKHSPSRRSLLLSLVWNKTGIIERGPRHALPFSIDGSFSGGSGILTTLTTGLNSLSNEPLYPIDHIAGKAWMEFLGPCGQLLLQVPAQEWLVGRFDTRRDELRTSQSTVSTNHKAKNILIYCHQSTDRLHPYHWKLELWMGPPR
jgi:hypothetical protein